MTKLEQIKKTLHDFKVNEIEYWDNGYENARYYEREAEDITDELYEAVGNDFIARRLLEQACNEIRMIKAAAIEFEGRRNKAKADFLAHCI